jgi:hypothetical protein
MKFTPENKTTSNQISRGSREHLLKTCCFATLTILCLVSTVRATVLDDLFQWAAKQPVQNDVWVHFAMTGSQLDGKNNVVYGEGYLYYVPGHLAPLGSFIPPYFSSGQNNITEYFSNRRFTLGSGLQLINYPFNPKDTDPLTVIISPVATGSATYAIDVDSSKWGDLQFTPSVNVGTNIIYGASGHTFYTVILYDQDSERPPP